MAINKAVKDRLQPDVDKWTLFEVEIMVACATYADGHRKLKLAEDQSDLQTDLEEALVMGRPVRKRKKKQLSSSSSEDDDDETYKPNPTKKVNKSAINHKSAGRLTRAPSPPHIPNMVVLSEQSPESLLHSLQSTSHIQAECHHSSSVESNLKQPEAQDLNELLPRETPIQRFQRISQNGSSSHENILPFPRMKTPTSPKVSGVEREMLKAISGVQVSLDGITKELEWQRKQMNTIMIKLEGTSQHVETEHVLEGLNLPLVSVEEVEVAEAMLSEKNVRTALVTRLAVVGGSSLKENVRRVMGTVLSNNVSRLYNWAGKYGWKSQDNTPKRAFGNLKLAAVITRAIMRNVHLKDVTEVVVTKEMMTWLRNSGDRNGGRKKRTLDKAAIQADHSNVD
ncbi:uncharacterized protein LOC121380060 [Gigantopelta aegis]|uniref:uncharacterized protein LOC121380060 n=1 Tax=Gigantopelta aegis TaxID=1735272 RepID=UPI001B88A9B9|nr:uncharacterized protein LOC121380060 [Gigantopelta aegis]XP_041364735.1 uncharacterized protein LOC121380060 [Gigantopelta aegis]